MNRPKPKILKFLEGTYRKDRDKNPQQDKVIISLDNLVCPDTLTNNKVINLWNTLVPSLIKIGLIGLQDYPLLEQTFMLQQEIYYIQDDLNRLRNTNDSLLSSKTAKIEKEKKINNLNNQLVKTIRQCSSNLSKLGFSPSDRAGYFNPTNNEDKNKDIVDDIIGDD